MFDLGGKVALVTGGSRGLGQGIVKGLSENGAKVLVNYRMSREKAGRVVEEVIENGGEAEAIQADVGREEDVLAMFKRIMERFGRLDILVNNAGIYVSADIEHTTLEIWNETIQCNLTSTFLCTRAAVGIMKRQEEGRIINISSVNAHMGTVTGTVHYAASKAGQIAIAKTLALDLAPHNITVNSVAPGIIYTDMTPQAIPTEQMRRQLEQGIPLGFGRVEDVAAAVVYLASDEAKYVTGATIDVNGGRYFR
jgi:3-oxoacyl-[acyl-carrier protein] reductase